MISLRVLNVQNVDSGAASKLTIGMLKSPMRRLCRLPGNRLCRPVKTDPFFASRVATAKRVLSLENDKHWLSTFAESQKSFGTADGNNSECLVIASNSWVPNAYPTAILSPWREIARLNGCAWRLINHGSWSAPKSLRNTVNLYVCTRCQFFSSCSSEIWQVAYGWLLWDHCVPRTTTCRHDYLYEWVTFRPQL